jgi:hypothetical protein
MGFESGFSLVVEGEIVVQDNTYDMDIFDGGDDRNSNEENEKIIVSAPTVGMEFDSIKEALQYFRLYAKQIGFGVYKRSCHKKG